MSAVMARLHKNARDLTGMRTGRLSVVRISRRDSDGHLMWHCVCDCGKTKDIASNSLTRRKPVQSCGCMNATTAQAKKLVNGPWNDGKSYAIKDGEHCYKTRHAWAKAVVRHYGNACQLCGWNKARCDAHHRIAKAKGGAHTIENGIVLCPNCIELNTTKGGVIDAVSLTV